MSVAVILTTYNRKEKTIQCLRSISCQKNMPSYDIFLCDDNSSDGTSESILEEFPKAILINGTGDLFWTRGMYYAMQKAVSIGYDYYLMVNDDVKFFNDMWETMFTYFVGSDLLGVTGCTVSESGGQLTYSGAKFYHDDGRCFVGCKIGPSNDDKLQCDVANWNCFLISKNVIEVVGLIDPIYEHSFGDYDFSLRMRKHNIPIYISHKYIGYCENNSFENTYLDSAISIRKRIKKIFDPNGLPVKSWFVFTHRYYGKSAFRNFVVPYIKFFTSLIKNVF